MPAGIDVLERVVAHVAVSVKVLWIPRPGHNRIRLHEAPQRRVVVARIVKVQPYCTIFPLPREAEDGGGVAGGLS
jgi:hypothetical protein